MRWWTLLILVGVMLSLVMFCSIFTAVLKSTAAYSFADEHDGQFDPIYAQCYSFQAIYTLKTNFAQLKQCECDVIAGMVFYYI
jgi:flagellar basal body-associated protein FliL